MAAAPSVFRVIGTACGLGVEGSGWVAAPELVVTNAHVVAGVKDAPVDRGDGEYRDADVVVFDSRNDVAVLRVGGLDAAPLRLVAPVEGAAVAILGYPENGPFTATPARIGQTGAVLTDDAYGRGPVRARSRRCAASSGTATRAGRRSTRKGEVQATIFASRMGGSAAGYGDPRRRRPRRARRTPATPRSRPAPASARARRGSRAAAGTARRRRRRPPSRATRRSARARARGPTPPRPRPQPRSRSCTGSGTTIPGTSLWTRTASWRLGIGQMPTRSGIGERPPKWARNASR